MTVWVWNRCLVPWSLQQVLFPWSTQSLSYHRNLQIPNESFVSVRLWERLDFHCHDLRDGPQDREWLAGMLIVDIWTPFIPRLDIFPRRVCAKHDVTLFSVPKTHDRLVAVLTPSTNSKDSLKHSPWSLFLNVEWTAPNIGCRESTVSQALSVTTPISAFEVSSMTCSEIARTPKMATFWRSSLQKQRNKNGGLSSGKSS